MLPIFRITLYPADEGDCILLTFGEPDALRHILIDGGTSRTYPRLRPSLVEIAAAGEALVAAVVSHNDADHIGGILALANDPSPPLIPQDIWFNTFDEIADVSRMGVRQAEVLAVRVRGLKWPLNRAFGGGPILVEEDLRPMAVDGLAISVLSPDTLDDALKAEGVGPFVSAFRRTPDRVRKSDGREAKWLRDRYLSDANSWRRIDDDWLTAGGSLALKLDSDTNNTSLVLAFEVEPGGEVLLFAADAQVGNWLSWHDQPYPHPSQNGVTSATAIDLLRRTILYKVGHHASHNATLEEAGLELMVHPGLTAMIPVDEGEARRVNAEGNAVHRGWDMPYPELYARLIEKTDGRVLRGDAEAGFDPRGVRICKDAELLGRVQSTAIFHELRVA